MKALMKTLIGDRRNFSVVAGIVVLDYVLATAGYPQATIIATPLVTLGGVAWLAVA